MNCHSPFQTVDFKIKWQLKWIFKIRQKKTPTLLIWAKYCFYDKNFFCDRLNSFSSYNRRQWYLKQDVAKLGIHFSWKKNSQVFLEKRSKNTSSELIDFGAIRHVKDTNHSSFVRRGCHTVTQGRKLYGSELSSVCRNHWSCSLKKNGK